MSRNVIYSALAAACLSAFCSAGCSTTWPRVDPTGKTFPDVRGSSLAGTPVLLPKDLAGAPALLFVGYKQMSQFDIDRWLLGLDQAGVKVKTLELPTIPGILPGLFAGSIDGGMRSGIPSEDWAIVVTVYDDAGKIAAFLGNANGLPARVVLLDGAGRVVFFHDEGYSVAALKRLQEKVAALGSPGPSPPAPQG